MKQTIVLALFSLVVAVAAGTWFAMALAPRPLAEQAHDLAASGAGSKQAGLGPKPVAASKPGESGAVKAAAPAPTQRDSTRAHPADSGASAAAKPAPAPTIDPAIVQQSAKSVAKVVASMKPKEAVGILSRLSDDEVERIVRQLNAKQVAALLAAFPQERAAAMSRRLLDPRKGNEGGAR